MPDKIARLRVEIDDVVPAVIRRIEVPLDIRLDDLHFVLQIAIGWQNCHPFEFRAAAADIGEATDGTAWGLVDRDDPESNRLPAESATLAKLSALGTRFHYDYVYGEDWTHIVELESISEAAHGTKYPRLVSAQGRCPPADIGGVAGYETYLLALGDPNHLHHEAMRDFDDPDFDPDVVDEATIRANLANLAKYLGRRPQR
jgi:Plasmid pRiA4b ORF-3-like protein